MHNRTRMVAAAAAVTAAVAASSGAAIASTTGAKSGAPAKTMSASGKPHSTKAATPAAEQQGHAALAAAAAKQLHVSAARVNAALQPLFAAGHADTSSPAFTAAARSLGVTAQQLATALMHAKQSLANGMHARVSRGSSKTAGAQSAGERQAHNAMAAAVAGQLHVSAARVNAALRPLFAAGHADTSSPAFTAAARSLGVTAQQLATALMHAKQSQAAGS